MGLRSAWMENATEHITEATPQRRLLVRAFRACLPSSLRAAHSAEQMAEVDQLTRSLVRFLRHRRRLSRARGRFRRRENQGESARMAWPLNHIAIIDLRAGRMKNYNRSNTGGHGPEKALGSNVSSPSAFFPAGRPSLPGI